MKGPPLDKQTNKQKSIKKIQTERKGGEEKGSKGIENIVCMSEEEVGTVWLDPERVVDVRP